LNCNEVIKQQKELEKVIKERKPMSISMGDRVFMKFSCCLKCKTFDQRRENYAQFDKAVNSFMHEIDVIRLVRLFRVTELIDQI